MDPRCRVEMLAGLTVRQAGREITRFKTQKCASLLAYLAYHLGRAHKREVLAELLWPERPPRAGRTNLNTALSSLRRQLEPPGVPAGAIIQGDRFAVQLNPEAITTDVADFQSLLHAAGDAQSATECRQLLTDAVDLYQGELLPGFYENWVVPEQRKLADQYFDAVLALVGLLEEAGQTDESVDLLRLAVTHDPLREEVHAELMRLLAVAGQPEAALRQYAEITAYLDEELERTPSAPVRRLAELIEARGADLRPADLAEPPEPKPAPPQAPSLPSGTVTFLLTDIEGCTELWERLGDQFRPALDAHHEILRREFAAHRGTEAKEAGDAFIVTFPSAADAVACAIACQRALEAHEWPGAVGKLRVRMALYTGDVSAQGDDYHDLALNRASRILTAAHGGQIVATEATVTLLRQDPRPGVAFADLGIYRLRDVPGPQRLFQVNYPDMPQREFPALRAEAGRAAKLPPQFTRFFGRQAQLQDLEQLLAGDDVRLVTLTGAGGCGKTRLALELAARLVERFEGAVWFVSLADLSDPQLIPGAVTDALGLSRSQSPDALAPVVAELGRQPSLLVLDNMEQFAAEGGIIVHELLQRVPELTCLVTSREHLNLPEEREFVVPPLPTPGEPESLEELARCESVQLFVDRAQAARPDFQVTAGNAEAVGTLCEHLDGLPLAIELAAARAQVLTPSQMVEQLDRRFEFLVSRRRVAEKRHKTLRAAIEWSYHLLSPAVQRFFAGLSVFSGGWTAEAAEAVCEEPNALDYLEQLIGSSLVLSEETPDGMRFRMLETLREFAEDQLDPTALMELRQRHGDYYLRLGEEGEEGWGGWKSSQWWEMASRELGNFRAALRHLMTTPTALVPALRLVTHLRTLWERGGHWREAQQYIAELMERDMGGVPAEDRASALLLAGRLAGEQHDHGSARGFVEEALNIARMLGDRRTVAEALWLRGSAALGQGQRAEALGSWREARAILGELGEESAAGHLDSLLELWGPDADRETRRAAFQAEAERLLEAARASGDRLSLGWALYGLGQNVECHTAARERHKESLAIARQVGDQKLQAWNLHGIGRRALGQRDYDGARAAFDEGAAAFRVLGSDSMVAACQEGLAQAALALGDPKSALTHASHALAALVPLGYRNHALPALHILASAELVVAHAERAAVFLGAFDALADLPDHLPVTRTQDDHDRCVAAVRDALGQKAFNEAWQKGQAMTLEAAVAYALASTATEGEAE